MKKNIFISKKTNLLSFAVVCSFVFACSKPTLENGLDQFYREYALEKYDDGINYSAPLYSFLNAKNNIDNNFIYKNDLGENYSLITGKKIADSNIYYKEYEGFSYYSLYGPNSAATETKIYDVFGNCLTGRFYLDNRYIENYVKHKIAFVSPLSKTYKSIFGEPTRTAKTNELLTIEAFSIMGEGGSYYFFKYVDDSLFNFENVIKPDTTLDNSEIVFVDYDYFNHIERTNKYECSIEYTQYTNYYYVNKSDKSGKIYEKRKNKEVDSYQNIFSFSYMNFSYYYSVESTFLTNDFDFYYDGNFGGAFGINLSKGNYKIHSSHKGKYFPLAMGASANHDYLWGLCLRIGKNKMLEPTYYAVKFSSGGKVSNYYTDVDLLLNEKHYIKFDNSYLLLSQNEYSKLRFLNDFAYVTKGGDNSLNVCYLNKGTKTETILGDIMCVFDEERYIFSYNNSSIFMLDTVNNNVSSYAYTRLLDKENVLYSIRSKLYFQNILISNNDGYSTISVESKYTFHSKNSFGKYLVYYNNTTQSYYYITCWSTNYEK